MFQVTWCNWWHSVSQLNPKCRLSLKWWGKWQFLIGRQFALFSIDESWPSIRGVIKTMIKSTWWCHVKMFYVTCGALWRVGWRSNKHELLPIHLLGAMWCNPSASAQSFHWRLNNDDLLLYVSSKLLIKDEVMIHRSCPNLTLLKLFFSIMMDTFLDFLINQII